MARPASGDAEVLRNGLRKGLGSSAGPMLMKVGLAANPELTAFFSLHDGMTLFCYATTGKHPVEIYKLKSIPAKTRAMQRWIRADDFPEIETAEDRFGLRTAIATGGSPNSSIYLAVAVQASFVGSVINNLAEQTVRMPKVKPKNIRMLSHATRCEELLQHPILLRHHARARGQHLRVPCRRLKLG